MDTTHLVALHESLDREKQRLAEATSDKERAFREHCICQKKKEIAQEYKFLNMTPDEELPDISNEDLLAELLKK
jgi:hypothetical protein